MKTPHHCATHPLSTCVYKGSASSLLLAVYILVLLLICLGIINLGLIVYVWRVLDLNTSGAGPVRFNADNLRIEGSAQFLHGALRMTLHTTSLHPSQASRRPTSRHSMRPACT